MRSPTSSRNASRGIAFNGSGISRFNRILERHDSAHGMYWRTYDFDEPPANLADRLNGTLVPDPRNVFAFPLGPAGLAEFPFRHAGGEAILALPNGLHAYYIANAANVRLDKGPIAIVSDPKRPDRSVEAGVSCMSCHVTGILPKADQMIDHLAKNPTGVHPRRNRTHQGALPRQGPGARRSWRTMRGAMPTPSPGPAPKCRSTKRSARSR